MTAPHAGNANVVAAGIFGEWLTQTRAALRGAGGVNVPCGDCVGCCVSSYYIPIRPEDSQARVLIPAHLLVTAAGQRAGHAMLRYLDDGRCPMLSVGKCSIYMQRPQTCRDYDCRVFAAAGIDAGDSGKAVINRRVHAWRFTHATSHDLQAHRAVQAAASFIKDHGASFPGGRAPTAPTGIAVLAIKVYTLFLDELIHAKAAAHIAVAIIEASREFDAGLT